jgi:hypothetical protein
MKKFFRYFFVTVLVFLNACSSPSDEDQIDDDNNQIEEVVYYQTFKYDNQVILDNTNYTSINSPTFRHATEKDGFLNVTFSILDGNSNRLELILAFDKFGNFGTVYFIKWFPDNTHQIFESFVHNSGNYFNFQLESYDVVNNTVKGNYSGRVYSDKTNLNSNFKNIEGSFFVKITQADGTIGKPNVKSKFNGIQWHPTNSIIVPNNEINAQDATYGVLSDDAYKIVIGLKRYEPIANHQFNNSNTDFFVKLAKFNNNTMAYDYFESSSGNITITAKEAVSPISVNFKGTFSFTATNPLNPTEIISITEGSFEKVFYY